MTMYLYDESYTGNVFQQVNESLIREEVHEQLETLSKNEAHVIRLRYGIGYVARCNSEKPYMTQREIAEIIKLSHERIGQIEAKAMKKLRHPEKRKILRPLLRAI